MKITDFKYAWSGTTARLDDLHWKYSTKESPMKRNNGGDHLYIQMIVPDTDYDKLGLSVKTNHNPVEVSLDGQLIYQNSHSGKTSGQFFYANSFNFMTLPEYAVHKEIIIHITVQSALDVNIFVNDANEKFSFLSLFNILGIITGVTFLGFGLIIFIMSLLGSVFWKNMFLTAQIGIFIALSGLYIFMVNAEPILAFQNILNSLLIEQAVLAVLFPLAAVIISLMFKSKAWSFTAYLIQALFIAAAFVLFYNFEKAASISAYVLPAAFAACGAFTVGMLISAIGKAKHNAVEVLFIYFIFTGTILYDSLTLSLNNLRPLELSVFGMIIFFVIHSIFIFNDVFQVNIRDNEKEKQLEQSKMWITRMLDASSAIFSKRDIENFCIEAAIRFKELIVADSEDSLRVSEENRQADNISVQVAMKTKSNYEIKYTEGDAEPINFGRIERRVRQRGESPVAFGTHYLNICFLHDNEAVAIIHMEGFVHCLSENIKNILTIAFSNISMSLKNLILQQDMVEAQEMIIFNIAEMSEAKSNETGQHLKRVSEYVKILCGGLKLGKEETEIVSKASILHDIGKLTISEDIIGKSGRLSDFEYEKVKYHTVNGFEMLKKSPGAFMHAAAIIAQQHHEKWDGSGYYGLEGEKIHLYGRIVALADVFDALTSKRSYKKAWSLEEAYNHINEMSGKHFDPKVVEAFNKNFGKIVQVQQKYPN